MLDGGRVGAFVRGEGEEEDDDQENRDEEELEWVAGGRDHDGIISRLATCIDVS